VAAACISAVIGDFGGFTCVDCAGTEADPTIALRKVKKAKRRIFTLMAASEFAPDTGLERCRIENLTHKRKLFLITRQVVEWRVDVLCPSQGSRYL
jgi:hypothetical protein